MADKANSKPDEDDNDKKAGYYVKLDKVMKLLQVVSAILLIVVSVLRFFNFASMSSPTVFVLTVYFLVFSCILVGMEFPVFHKCINCHKSCFFLNFGWGKALFNFFLACMILSGGYGGVVEVIAAICLLINIAIMIVISLCFRTQEREAVELKKLES
jgi:hypothetical protein